MNLLLQTVSRWGAALGIAVLFGCAAITVVDIVSRRTIGLSLPGLIDLTQLLVMTSMFLCIPYTFQMRANVDVDLIHKRLSPALQRGLDALWGLLSAAWLLAVVGYAGAAALQVLEYGETSPTLAVPMVAYWLPILIGCLLAAIICLWQAASPAGAAAPTADAAATTAAAASAMPAAAPADPTSFAPGERR